jgi:hypothetical protein
LVNGSPKSVRDRDVVLLLALVVSAVLAINVVSGIVPGVDRLLATAPVLVVVLLLGTGLVVLGVVRRSR